MAIAKLFSSSPVLIFCLVSLVHPLPFSFKTTNKDEPLSHNLGRLPLPSNFFSKGELHPSTDDDMEAKFYAAVSLRPGRQISRFLQDSSPSLCPQRELLECLVYHGIQLNSRYDRFSPNDSVLDFKIMTDFLYLLL